MGGLSLSSTGTLQDGDSGFLSMPRPPLLALFMNLSGDAESSPPQALLGGEEPVRRDPGAVQWEGGADPIGGGRPCPPPAGAIPCPPEKSQSGWISLAA